MISLNYKQKIILLFVVPTLIFLFFILIYPIINLFWLSFTETKLATPFIRPWAGLRNFVKFFNDSAALSSFKYTFYFIAGALLLQVPLGISFALLLESDLIPRGTSFYITLFILPLAIAPVTTALFWRMILHNQFGLLNYFLGVIGLDGISWWGNPQLTPLTLILIDSWRWTPFVVLMVYAGLKAVPYSLIEAAKIDGASSFQRLLHIKLPLIKKNILVVILLRFILAQKKVFDIITATTDGGPGRVTETMNFRIYKALFTQFDLGYTATLSLILLIIVIIITQPFVRKVWG